MIHVTQGHEKSIALEIFLRSFLCQPEHFQHSYLLHVFKEELITNLHFLGIDFQIKNQSVYFNDFNIKLNCVFLKSKELPQSTISIESALEAMKKNDILLTLPTSKDQLINEQQKMELGHTEYFRTKYKISEIPMTFFTQNLKVLLLTDHIPLKNVINLKSQDVVNKISYFIHSSKIFFGQKKLTFIFSGINPHHGEGGLLGNEDFEIKNSLIHLKKQFINHEFIGPFSGDTLLINSDQYQLSTTVFVYCYHDQGLAAFKALNRFQGVNLTFCPDFIRVSVDHGTAFELYGKNCADISGQLFVMDFIRHFKMC